MDKRPIPIPILERHGIANAVKCGRPPDDLQSVTVTDGIGQVAIGLSSPNHLAGLTPGQAIFIAKKLIASAKRVQARADGHPGREGRHD